MGGGADLTEQIVAWERECPGYIISELVDGKIVVTCYGEEEPPMPPTDNLCPNPSFEEKDPDQNRPISWVSRTDEGQSVCAWDDAVYRSGSRSVRVESLPDERGRWYSRRTISVTPGKAYQLVGWIKSAATEVMPYICFNFWKEDRVTYISGSTYRAVPTGVFDGDWEQHSLILGIVAPEEAAFARVECRGWWIGGSVWFDDMWFGLQGDHKTLEEVLLEEAARQQLIEFNPDAALQKAIFAEGFDGFVPNSKEFDVTHGGVEYRGQRTEHLGTGEVRVYYCIVGDWQNVQYVVRPPIP